MTEARAMLPGFVIKVRVTAGGMHEAKRGKEFTRLSGKPGDSLSPSLRASESDLKDTRWAFLWGRRS